MTGPLKRPPFRDTHTMIFGARGGKLLLLQPANNSRAYLFALSSYITETDTQYAISFKKQTTTSVSETSWPEDWNWKNGEGILPFTPVWRYDAPNLAVIAAAMHNNNMFLFAIDENDSRLMYKRETNPSTNTWNDWKKISLNYSVRPPVYAGCANGSSKVQVFAIDNATGKIRAFKKEPTVGSDDNQWSSYLIGDQSISIFALHSKSNHSYIFATNWVDLFTIQSAASGSFPSNYTRVGPPYLFISTNEVKLSSNGIMVTQYAAGGLWEITSDTAIKITSDWTRHFEVVSSGNNAYLLYLSETDGMKLWRRSSSGIWSQVPTSTYPNQSAHPVDQTCLKAYNYPSNNTAVFFGNFDNTGIGGPALYGPSLFFDVWQIKNPDWTLSWKNLGGLYSY